MFLELMASKLYGVAKVRNTKKNAWCLQWNMVVAVSLCGAAWVLLVSGSCISLMASWIHKCTALYWKRRCYHHSVPLVVVHFSNMTMFLNTHLRPLLDFWRRTGWKWFSGSWTEPNRTHMGNSEETSWASLSIQHPISKTGHSWRMEKGRSGKMSPTCSCLEELVLSLKIMAIQSTRFSSFCCGVYSFLHHPNLNKTEKCVI